jgi:agmatine/peptidylarginine deiminase
LLAWVDEDWCKEAAERIVAAAYEHVQIIMLVDNQVLEEESRETMRRAGIDDRKVRYVVVPTDTFWVRDYGPVVQQAGPNNLKLLDGDYWAGSRIYDDRASFALGTLFRLPVVNLQLDMEWGALLCNGAGICLVADSLLQRNLQRGNSESFVTNTLKRVTGAEQVVYLQPLFEEPNGHIDWFATFTSADTVVVGDYGDRDPQNDTLLDRHAEQLANLETPSGRLNVERIPMPPRNAGYFGGSYTNVAFANGVLLVPTWDDAPPDLESEALAVFRRLLPDWQIVGIDCGELGVHSGALRCATMNLFRVAPPSANQAARRRLGPSLSESKHHTQNTPRIPAPPNHHAAHGV